MLCDTLTQGSWESREKPEALYSEIVKRQNEDNIKRCSQKD